jgi:hypothetical protein
MRVRDSSLTAKLLKKRRTIDECMTNMAGFGIMRSPKSRNFFEGCKA